MHKTSSAGEPGRPQPTVKSMPPPTPGSFDDFRQCSFAGAAGPGIEWSNASQDADVRAPQAPGGARPIKVGSVSVVMMLFSLFRRAVAAELFIPSALHPHRDRGEGV